MSVRRRKRATASVPVALTLFVAALLIGVSPASANSNEELTCTRQAGKFTPGKPVKPPITLTPDVPAQTVNFGGDRDWKFVDIVLKASRPLPPRVKAKHLDLEVLRRLVRQGDTTTTIASRPIKFTRPRLNPRRDTITFTICLDGADLEAGHYLGAISAEGPRGVGPVTLTIGANARNSYLFWLTLGITGVLVFILMLWRGATTEQSNQAKEVAAEVKGARAGAAGSAGAVVTPEMKEKAEKATITRRKVSRDVLKNPIFYLTTAVSAAVAIGAAVTIYTQDTGWGSDPVTDVFAVATAVLAAAGFRSLLLTTAGK